MEGSIGGGW
jgi:hypothetical protein